MKPIAVFLHCRLSGGDPPISFPWASGILAEQIIAMRDSGLTAAASEMYLGVNGGAEDTCAAAGMAPDKSQVIQHPDGARGEHPTLRMMQEWARAHPRWHVLYLHTKGATHTGDPINAGWRRCMMNVVVGNWERCVKALESGFDAAGAHWITGEQYSFAPVTPYFAGNFFWATSDFIATLPLITPTAVERLNFYDSEVLIARGPRPAKAMDFARHWPGAKCLQYAQQH